MALGAITYIAGSAYAESAASTTITSVSQSPSNANGLLIAVVHRLDTGETGSVASLSTTINITGGWTIVQGVSTGQFFPCAAICYAQMTSSPGTGTVTATFTSATDVARIQLFELPAGYDTTTPVAQSKGAQHNGTATPSVTFDSTPASGSRLLATVNQYDGTGNSATPGSGWSELYDGASFSFHDAVEEAAGSNGTTIDFTLDDAGSNSGYILGVEFQEAAASGSSPSPIFETIFRAVNS